MKNAAFLLIFLITLTLLVSQENKTVVIEQTNPEHTESLAFENNQIQRIELISIEDKAINAAYEEGLIYGFLAGLMIAIIALSVLVFLTNEKK